MVDFPSTSIAFFGPPNLDATLAKKMLARVYSSYRYTLAITYVHIYILYLSNKQKDSALFNLELNK